MLNMWHWNLITQEKAKEASEGKLKDILMWGEISINDDLEMFLTNLLNSKEIKKEGVVSFLTPKLTKEELKLVEEKNKDHLESYWAHFNGENPDVMPEEMKKSDSTSKYVHGTCFRFTFSLTLEEVERNRKRKSQSKAVAISIEALDWIGQRQSLYNRSNERKCK